MRMRVIPIHAGWLICGNPETILKQRLTGLNRSMNDIVLVTERRDLQPVEV
jgi:hypothetical protein